MAVFILLFTHNGFIGLMLVCRPKNVVHFVAKATA